MKDITIDCRGFVPRSDLHKAFADALSFPDHYGNNLDALHDCLTDISEQTRIRLLHWKAAEETLGNYARSAKRAILDAATKNPNLAVLFD
ncbi:MAG: barstar family protein [Oscillospiraceae bacterium]|nr:barstar family protein [Oscillospiraceae bacterium]